MTITALTALIDDETLDDALLLAVERLTRYDGHLIPWAAIRHRLPGTRTRQGEASVRLWLAHRLNSVKIDGRNYVSLPDELDRQAAAIELANGTPRRPIVLDRTA
ncbi:MAG: hypothetical protein ACOYB7_02900 [Mycobacterium sp.]